jgi:ADP-ribose pyrophosphatase YjhB (NUDIX family)
MSEVESNWIPDAEWARIQRLLPIACADVLVTRSSAGGLEVGLILRDSPDGQRWCLVGGRILRDESIRDAILRQLTSTLGDGVQCSLDQRPRPDFIAKYFADQREGELHDPRQHALGLTFALTVTGSISARGEAIEFRWFPVDDLPSANEFGFGQRAVVEAVLQRLSGSS